MIAVKPINRLPHYTPFFIGSIGSFVVLSVPRQRHNSCAFTMSAHARMRPDIETKCHASSQPTALMLNPACKHKVGCTGRAERMCSYVHTACFCSSKQTRSCICVKLVRIPALVECCIHQRLISECIQLACHQHVPSGETRCCSTLSPGMFKTSHVQQCLVKMSAN
jgi:hypothetical protein